MASDKPPVVLPINGDEKNGSSSLKDNEYTYSPYFSEKPQGPGVSRLPSLLQHFKSRDLKELVKCSVAVWIATILIFIEPTLNMLGQAAFFGSLVQFIAPPSGVVFIQIMAVLTVILGACLGWAWGAITMKAALATRPVAEVNAKLAALQQSAAQNTTNPQQASGSSYAQIAIYEGYMLDTRVSITYFAMMCLFIYFMARLRVKAPKLTLVSMFAMIVADIYLTIAPLLPTFNGTLPQTLIKPAGVAVGIGVVCNILIFPRSTSHAILDGVQDVIKPMSAFIDASCLYLYDPSRHMQLKHLQKVKLEIIQGYKALEASLGFLSLDISYGRWSSDDVLSLKEPLRSFLTSFMALIQFYVSREQSRLKDERYSKLSEPTGADEKEVSPLREAGGLQLRRALDFRERMRHPDMNSFFNESLKVLKVSSDGIFGLCRESLAAIEEALYELNSRRWFGHPSQAQCNELSERHAAILEHLKKEISQFSQKAEEHLLASNVDMFDDQGHLKPHDNVKFSAPIVAIVFALGLQKRILNFAEALASLLSQIILLEQTRTKTRLWLPKSLTKLFGWALDRDTAVPGALARTITMDPSDVDRSQQKPKRGFKAKRQAKKDANAEGTAKHQLQELRHRHAGRQRRKSGQLLLNFLHWLTNTEGLFALRVVLVTIAVGVPAVIPTSSGFFYREKGLWAVIMAQTGLVEYTADFIFGFGVRVIGTVLGGIIGMMVWYIGAGNGPGNSYGMAAIMAPVIVVFMYLRLFGPPVMLQASILGVATIFLVMSYSWVDTHIPSYGNPGVGYEVFWRRTLLVLIGMVAGAIVILFPRPPSANRHYRQVLNESLQSVKDRYALFAANFKDDIKPPPDLREVTTETAIDSFEILTSIAGPIKLVRFEFSSSPFDAISLSKVCQLCSDLNLNITQLLLYATNLSGHPKTRFTLISGALNEEVIGDIMAVVTLAQHSLTTGEPLPGLLPVPLLGRSMEGARARLLQYQEQQHINDPTLQTNVLLTKDMLAEDGFRQYCEALGAFIETMSNLDELIMVIKHAVGETSVIDTHSRVDGAERGVAYV